MSVSAKQFCTFRLSDFHFGIEATQVQEIIRYQRVTRVPLSHPSIKGLINLRGQLVTAIDLRHRLELPEYTFDEADPKSKPPMNVIVASANGLVSLLVDRIGDVIEVEEQLFEPAPDTLRGSVRELLIGVYKLKDYLLLSLDLKRTTQLVEVSEENKDI